MLIDCIALHYIANQPPSSLHTTHLETIYYPQHQDDREERSLCVLSTALQDASYKSGCDSVPRGDDAPHGRVQHAPYQVPGMHFLRDEIERVCVDKHILTSYFPKSHRTTNVSETATTQIPKSAPTLNNPLSRPPRCSSASQAAGSSSA